MCQALNTIKFCTCPENLNLSKKKENSHYVWILERVSAVNDSGILGLTMLPSEQLDELIPEFIVMELNSKNLFDFEYEPQENDSLRIERVDRAKTREREYLFGEYLNFYFLCGEWHIGQVSPFMYHIELYENGKVQLGKTTPS